MKKNYLPMIFCHILGLCSLDKTAFIDFCKFDSKIVIHDFNDINENYIAQSKYDSSNAMHDHKEWRQYMEQHLMSLFIRDSKKIIILLGYPIHYNDKRIEIVINSKIKCFVKVTDHHYTTQTIMNNITLYQDSIVNGEFPLDYLNPIFLLKNRQTLIKMFPQYGLKSIDRIYNIIRLNIAKENELKSLKTLYCTHADKFDIFIPASSRGIDAYTEDWLSLVGFSTRTIGRKQNGIIKGYKKNKPYIKEALPQAFNALNRSAYLYTVEKFNFMFHEKGKQKKLYTHSSVIIAHRKRIPNVYKYLLKLPKLTLIHYVSH